jgi:hypothetical protein
MVGTRSRLLIGVALALALSACGGDGDDDQTPAATTPATTLAQGPRNLPRQGAVLEAGVYSPESFQPKFSFEVGDGWRNFGQLSAFVAVAPVEVSPTAAFGDYFALDFLRLEKVFDPPLQADEVRKAGQGKSRPAPKDLAAYLHGTGYATVTAANFVTLDGRQGVTFDVTITDLPETPPTCHEYGVRCLVPFDLPGPVDFALGEKEPTRWWVLDVDGQQVAIVAEAPPGRLAEFAPRAETVVQTVKFL